MKILILNGPSLNLLGKRNPDVYGNHTLEDIQAALDKKAQQINIDLIFAQSNHEGELIDTLQKNSSCDGVIFNPGAFTHTSIAIADALESIDIPTVEVHLSNIYAREEFRSHSYIAPIAIGQISGFGLSGYLAALDLINEYLQNKND
ncbi:MAG: type II 3-dehydroquinate dehydratase [Chloroflexi bacterium]|nr:type II 3-dehydroquinate dehydratase [Chloroflexota bacterium]|tara:strand:- start:5530 stop:5970 length:441 start_codon:yes stop_codon:yes gene_type:complete